jgi:hypothetical protein
MTKATAKDVLVHSLERDGVNLKAALDDVLADKIADAIDSVSAEIGAGIFGAEAAAEETDEAFNFDDYEEDLVEEVVGSLLKAAEAEEIELSEEDLMELSKDTLKSYLKGSEKASEKLSRKPMDSKQEFRAFRRMRGVDRAKKKLGGE